MPGLDQSLIDHSKEEWLDYLEDKLDYGSMGSSSGDIKGIQLFKSTSPTEGFAPVGDVITPAEVSCIDATLYEEDGDTYMVYSHGTDGFYAAKAISLFILQVSLSLHLSLKPVLYRFPDEARCLFSELSHGYGNAPSPLGQTPTLSSCPTDRYKLRSQE